eukprot:jgi/Hompol1/564/HPOL_005354-RA
MEQGVILSQTQKEFMLDEARILGFWPWLETFSHFHLADLFQVFDVELPEEMRSARPDQLLPLLHSVMREKAPRRQKLANINSIDDVVLLLKKSKNIIVLTGAGCSVSCGIPDFRSKNGIYSRLDEFELEDPQQMFDIHYFRYRPETFYSFAKLLEDKGKLLRNYTQNIDTLEKAAGIQNVVQCHGSFATARCISCGYSVPGTAIEEDIFAQQVPRCPRCSEDDDGIMKPDIVFFGEKLPAEFDTYFLEDRKKADLLLVMGSSLKVSPVADVKDRLPHNVPQILINLEVLPHMQNFDVQLLGYCDTIVSELCRRLGWELPPPQDSSGHVIPDAQSPEPSIPSIRPSALIHRHLFDGAIEADQDNMTSDSESDSGSDSESDSESGSESGSESDTESKAEVFDESDAQELDEYSVAPLEPVSPSESQSHESTSGLGDALLED